MRGTCSCIGLGMLLSTGCTVFEPLTAQTPASPPVSAYQGGVRREAPSPLQQASARTASPELARAGQVLDRLQSANAQLPVRAELRIKPTERPYIGHGGQSVIWVSEPLLSRCETEEQLAAVLALELAKISSERQQRVAELAQARENETPMEVRIGPDVGSLGDADQLHKVEIAKRGLERRKREEATQPIDPNLLARQYLSKAGYRESALDSVPGLFRVQVAPDAKRLPPITVPAPDARSNSRPTPELSPGRLVQ